MYRSLPSGENTGMHAAHQLLFIMSIKIWEYVQLKEESMLA